MNTAGTSTPAPARSRRPWIVGGLVLVALAAAAAQFAPMIAAAIRDSATPRSHPARSHPATDLAGAIPASTGFAPLSTSGGPPSGVLGSLSAPGGATVSGRENYDRSSGPYDRAVSYSTSLSQPEILSFYETFLPAHGWKVKGIYPVPGVSGREVLASRAGSDGYYWEVAISDPAPHRSGGSFQIRLQLVADQG